MVFLKILNSACSLFVYRKTIYFSMLTLYIPLLLSLLTCSRSVFVDVFKFTTYMIMSSANKDTFMFLFPIYIPLISFSCITALARTSSMMLKAMVSGDIIALSLILVGKL